MTDIPSSFETIQQESVQFNKPVSEAAASAIGAAVNALLKTLAPIGSYIFSDLNETQFQTAIGNPVPAIYILADGRDVTGSGYHTLTGRTHVPDTRGQLPRALNNGGSAAGTRNDGHQNPDDPSGTMAPGTQTDDKLKSHTHTFAIDYTLMTSGGGRGAGNDGDQYGTDPVQLDNQIVINHTGGNETAPKTVAGNFFIRIN